MASKRTILAVSFYIEDKMASKVKRKTVIHAVKCENGVVVAETEYDRNLLKNLPI